MENMTETVKGLRALEKATDEMPQNSPVAEHCEGIYLMNLREAAPALFARLEYLEKIVANCSDCEMWSECGKGSVHYCDDPPPLDGEKEGEK